MSNKEYATRVNQLDAIQLDGEILKIICDQIQQVLNEISTNLTIKYNPEIELLLKTVLWYFSIGLKSATFGQQLLGLKYNENNINKIYYHYFYTIAIKYIEHVLKLRMTNNVEIQKFLSVCNAAHLSIAILNFFRFLKVGKRPALIDFLLGLDVIPVNNNTRRNISYQYMTRELLFTGFIELASVLFPILNHRYLLRVIKNIFFGRRKLVNNKKCEQIMDVKTKCAYCNERPTLPYHMGCPHVFCYYCLKGSKAIDSDYQCPLCDWRGEEISKVICKI